MAGYVVFFLHATLPQPLFVCVCVWCVCVSGVFVCVSQVVVNGGDYQPQSASPNKKHAKAMAATVALQALGEVPVDGPGLYTGPVFTAATTGPLFSSSTV